MVEIPIRSSPEHTVHVASNAQHMSRRNLSVYKTDVVRLSGKCAYTAALRLARPSSCLDYSWVNGLPRACDRTKPPVQRDWASVLGGRFPSLAPSVSPFDLLVVRKLEPRTRAASRCTNSNYGLNWERSQIPK